MPGIEMTIIGLLAGYLLAYLFSYLTAHNLQDSTAFLAGSVCASCGSHQNPWFHMPFMGILDRTHRCEACSARPAGYLSLIHLVIMGLAIWAFRTLELFPALEISLVGFALVGVTTMDLKKWMIPNIFVLTILLASALGLIAGNLNLLHNLAGLIVGAIVSALMILPQRFGSGERLVPMGDVKLVLALSIWLGWVLSVYAFFLASLLASLVWLVLGLFRGFSIHRRVPFGPFVALASMIFGMARMLDPHFVTHLLSFRF